MTVCDKTIGMRSFVAGSVRAGMQPARGPRSARRAQGCPCSFGTCVDAIMSRAGIVASTLTLALQICPA